MRPANPAEIISGIEHGLAHRSGTGALPREAVEALDVVQHALAYCDPAGGMESWRNALRSGALSDVARTAVTQMVHDLNAAIERGEEDRVTGVCDCLQVLFPDEAGTTRGTAE
ncbi:hypothetical protein ACWDWO_12935 [Actinopolymorpha singaporensis]